MKTKNNPLIYFSLFVVALFGALGIYNYVQRQLDTSTDSYVTDSIESQPQTDAQDSQVQGPSDSTKPLSDADAAVLGTVLGKDKPNRSNYYGLLERLNGFETSWQETSPSRYSTRAQTSFVTQDHLSNTCVVLVYSNTYDAEHDRDDVAFKMNQGTTYWWGNDEGATQYISQGVILISNRDSTRCIDDANSALGW